MRVLIVDDIFTNRLLLAEILRNLDIDFDQVENGRQALDAIEQQHYDMVLMDIEMPVMNGLETMKYIRESLPPPKNELYVIALTAHNPQLFFEDFKDVGFNQLLVKPYNVDKVNALLSSFGPKAED